MDAFVKFDYDKQQDDEISLRSGDVLVNVSQVEEGWCKGTLNGVTGMFPDNFVDLKPAGSLSKPAPAPAPAAAARVEPVATSKKERRAKVAFSYVAGGDDELTLNPGEIVVVLDEVEEGWWKGKLDGREGVFPSNFVEEIEDEAPAKPTSTTSQTQLKTQEPADSSRRSASMVNVMPGRIGVDPNELRQKLKSVNTPTTTNEPPSRPPLPVAEKTPPPPAPVQALSPTSSSSGLKKAKVIFLYDAENLDEVSVKEGDIVEVLQFEDETEQEGWWMVKCANGKQGLVPDNFVELIQNAPVPDSKPLAPQPQKPPPPQVEKPMPNLPLKTPKPTSEPPPPSETTKAPPVGGVRLMPTGGLPVKSKSAVPLPAMPPKNDPPPPVPKMDPPRPDPHKTNEPDSGDLDIPRSDILDNKKMKDRPKMNSRRPPSRSSLHGGDDNEGESPPSSATPPAAPAPTSKSSPGMARAPWQKEMFDRKKKPGPPPLKTKPKPRPAAKPTPTADKEEEPKKTFTPTPITAVPPPTHSHTPSSHSHPPPPANVVKPVPPVASKVSGTKPDQRPAEDTSGEWKEAFEKLREEFNTFRKQIREEMNDLIDDLDRERKKRAEMEIDIDRLRRLRDKH